MASAPRPLSSLEPDESPARHLFEVTYQNRLRVVGRVLDNWRLDQAVIVDVDNGILLRAHDAHTGGQLAEMLLDENLTDAMETAIAERGRAGQPLPASTALHPTGYEDFLRALGFRLDRQRAQSIVIVECPRFFHVSGLEAVGPEEQAALTPFSAFYEVPKVNALVNEAVSRRRGATLFGGPSIDLTQLGRVMHSGASRRTG
jgi:hypothetical protein